MPVGGRPRPRFFPLSAIDPPLFLLLSLIEPEQGLGPLPRLLPPTPCVEANDG